VIIARVVRTIRVHAFQTLEYRLREVTAGHDDGHVLQFTEEIAGQTFERWINGTMTAGDTMRVPRSAFKQEPDSAHRGEQIDHPGLRQ
jgi:hypothetical protein